MHGNMNGGVLEMVIDSFSNQPRAYLGRKLAATDAVKSSI